MASSQQPKTVSWNTTTVTVVEPTSTPHAAETLCTDGTCTKETRGGIEGSSAASQAAKNIADVKETVDELMGSQGMGPKAIDPSKPRRFVSL